MPHNLNRLPRYFDAKLVNEVSLADIPKILSGRHPHLSATQHQVRMTVAAQLAIDR